MRQAACAAVLVMASVAGASAQQPTATTGVAQPRVEASSRVDVTKLPIDMARIRRQLVRVTVREERDGLNLRYQVDVFAKAGRELSRERFHVFFHASIQAET
jgi:hypothetical protein